MIAFGQLSDSSLIGYLRSVAFPERRSPPPPTFHPRTSPKPSKDAQP